MKYKNGSTTTNWTDLSSEQNVTALQFTFTSADTDDEETAQAVTLSGNYPVLLGTKEQGDKKFWVYIDADGSLKANLGNDKDNATEDNDAKFKATYLDEGMLTLEVGSTYTTAISYKNSVELPGTYGEVPFTMSEAATITGVLVSMDNNQNIETVNAGYTAPTDATAAESYKTVFLADSDAVLTGKLKDASANSTICLSYDKTATQNNYFAYHDGILVNSALTSADKDAEGNDVTYTFNIKLGVAEITVVETDGAGAAFDSSDIKVYADGTLIKTVTASADIDSADVYVDLGAKVSFDVVLSSDVLGVSENGVALASKDNYYTLSKDFAESGDKAVVVITFTSGDAGTFKFTLNVIASGDSSSSSATTSETYLLKVSDITITPANAVTNTAKLISADTDNYSATLSLTNLNSTASGDWGSFAEFTVSSDYLGDSFSITVSTDVKIVNVYAQTGTDWNDLGTDEVSGDVITPNTIGTYKVVLSADLIASSDKTVSGDAYFAFDFTVASVDSSSSGSEETAQDVVTDADNASMDRTGGAGNNPVISAGQEIETKFLNGKSISQSAFSSFFSSATTVTMLSETELAAALETLGLTESDMGDSENGYKALAFTLPSGFTLTEYEKFFVLLTTNENGTGTNRLGVGVVSPKLNGSRTMVIVFKLLKNPAHTADFMTFDAGEYFVGATNDTASADTSSSTRAVFVTAGGTFNIKSEEATLLQGQTASGTATPYEGDDDDDDNQETSSHGSSSGCDAGFGALALLAVAGALAARKVRK